MIRFRALFVATIAGLFVVIGGTTTGQPPPTPGTVTWTKNYPQGIDAPPRGKTGSIIVLGDYTANLGWAPQSAIVSHSLAGGGVPNAVALDFAGGKIGKLNGGVLGDATINVPKGTYTVNLAMSFKDGNQNVVAVVSQYFNVPTINR